MSQEKSKTPDVVMLPEHERYDIRSTFISQEEADELVRKGSTDSLPNFLGKLDKDAADKSKNGNVRSAQIIGTYTRRGELYPEKINLSYPGFFAKSLAKIRGKKAPVIANITGAKTPLTQQELDDPNNPYNALYDQGG